MIISKGTSNPSWWGRGLKLLKEIPQNLLLNQGDEDEDDVDTDDDVDGDNDDDNTNLLDNQGD